MENDDKISEYISPERLLLVAGPKLYRLAQKKDGAVILQGAYFWQDGNNYGHEWREIPTVELEEG